MPVEELYLHFMEEGAVESLQRTEHADVEQALAILYDGVHIVAEHALIGVFLEDAELVAIVTAKAITGRNPDESVAVEIDLVDETAG